jgi:transposase-like protein
MSPVRARRPSALPSDAQDKPLIICPTVMLQVRDPLMPRNAEDLLHERGIEISHKTVLR